MTVHALDAAAGISTFVMLFVGISMGILALRKWNKLRQDDDADKARARMVLLAAVVFITLGIPWLPTLVIFVMSLLGAGVISPRIQVSLGGWSPPVFGTAWLYITAVLYEKKWLERLVLVVSVCVGAMWYAAVFVVDSWNTSTIENSNMREVTYGWLGMIPLAIYCACALLFVAPTNFWLSSKSERSVTKFRTSMIGTGAIVYIVGVMLDIVITEPNIYVIVASRFVLTVALVFLFMGYYTPTWIRNRLQES